MKENQLDRLERTLDEFGGAPGGAMGGHAGGGTHAAGPHPGGHQHSNPMGHSPRAKGKLGRLIGWIGGWYPGPCPAGYHLKDGHCVPKKK